MAINVTYNNGIPDANHNPSVDQPPMRVNTDAVDTILAVDHVSFNTNGGGWHKQVTFASNNVPVPPVSPPVLFTKDVALLTTLPQIFYYSGNAAHSSNQYVNAAEGSTFAFGGVIVKWGTRAVPGSNPGTVTFPVAFPNNCYAVIVSLGTTTQAPSNTENYTLQADAFTVSQFTLTRSSTSKTLTFSYIAIGN